MTDMTVAEAARAAGVSERTMRRWIREGRLAGCYKLGGRVRIPERAIREAAEPYGDGETRSTEIDDVSVLDSSARKRLFELRRARLAVAEIDRIRARMKPPAGPDDTAVAYIRQGREEQDEKWDRLLGLGTDDPRR
jgi:excisionase family DNA binding protein